MYFGQLSQNDPERIFLAVQNSYSTAALAEGDWCGWDIVTDKNGYAVTRVAGAIRSAVAGVAVQNIASGAVGLIQVWGYKSGVKCKGGSGSLTSKLTAGSPLAMATGNVAIQAPARNSAAAKAPYGQRDYGVFIAPTNTAAKATSATTWRGDVMIRCL